MDFTLSAPEVRVLGCLLEKEATTPEYYPLTLNALVAACNQRNNRDPLVDYDEKTVARAIEDLREKHLVLRIDLAGSRVPKYGHQVRERFPLDQAQRALLCTLLLRGAQTVGELRGRTERLYPFRDLEQTEEVLQTLLTYDPEPLAVALPRVSGRKEIRYAHRLAGDPAPEEVPSAAGPRPEPAMLEVQGENQRLGALAAEVETLRAEMTALRAEVAAQREAWEAFRRQFE